MSQPYPDKASVTWEILQFGRQTVTRHTVKSRSVVLDIIFIANLIQTELVSHGKYSSLAGKLSQTQCQKP
ncbi:hypothetical protein J6590_044590 [Homalodisca vitripennis]|nr:hypothetical protein J6590_044590 [Homalodisca vitripennis]